MNFLSLLESKREGNALTPADLQRMVEGFVGDRIPDYQMAAFLMAVFFRGLNDEETHALTLAMRDSGETLKWPKEDRPVVDKHSTGGVGDKVSLPLAPLLACLGFRVPMISGRGLGITGGTLDKLESIPRFTTALSPRRLMEQVQEIGVAMAGQSDTMVPADRKLYALRDVTGTVPSVALITASILSKKLAEGLEALILDVKFGRAAFMPDEKRAGELARAMVELGQACGINTRAVLTDMNVPLGRACGNWLEVKESVACLNNRGPDDLRALVLECAAHLLVQTGLGPDLDAARRRAEKVLVSGAALDKWKALVRAQGGDVNSWESGHESDRRAPVVRELKSDRSGFVTRCDARIIGEVVRELGGGRLHREARIYPSVGVDGLRKPGESVSDGDVLCRVHARETRDAEGAEGRLREAFAVEDSFPHAEGESPLIRRWVRSGA